MLLLRRPQETYCACAIGTNNKGVAGKPSTISMESPTTALSRYTTTSPENSISPPLEFGEDTEKFCTAENLEECVAYFDHVSLTVTIDSVYIY